MLNKIFVNLPVKDLEASKAFFAVLGYGFDMRFTDAKAACMVMSASVYVMLLVEPFFKTFLDETEIANRSKVTQALFALSFESREEVDALMEKVLKAGGREPRPAEDHGFMYERSFADLDGHLWGPFWMDVDQMQAAKAD